MRIHSYTRKLHLEQVWLYNWIVPKGSAASMGGSVRMQEGRKS